MKDSKKDKLVNKAQTHIASKDNKAQTNVASKDRDRTNTPIRKPDGICEAHHSRVGHKINDSDSLSKKGEKISFDSAGDLSEEIAAIRERK